MKTRRGRRIALLIVVFGVATSGLAAWVSRDLLLVHWYLWRLDSESEASKRASIQALGRLRATEAVAPLVVLATSEGALRLDAVEALVAILPGSDADQQKATGSALLAQLPEEVALNSFTVFAGPGIILGGEPDSSVEATVFRRLGPLVPHAFDHFAEELGKSFPARAQRSELLGSVLLESFPDSADELASLLKSFKSARAHAFFTNPPLYDPDGAPGPSRALGLIPKPAALSQAEKLVLPMARRFASDHPDPRIRAIAFAYAITRSRHSLAPVMDEKIIRDAMRDRDPLVRRSTARLCGIVGPQPGVPDPLTFLGGDKDASVLASLVGARQLWSLDTGVGIKQAELLDDVTWTYWIDPGYFRRAPLDEEDAGHLHELLRTRPEPELRDAASAALASRLRRSILNAPDRVTPPVAQGLRVAEWGVFAAAGETLVPPASLQSDGPSFVYHSGLLTDELWQGRLSPAAIAYKPIVFFYSPSPVSLLVRVHFYQGRPWSYYPAITDYVASTRDHRASLSSRSTNAESIGGFDIRTDLLPPEMQSATRPDDESKDPTRGDASPLYDDVPWTRDRSQRIRYNKPGKLDLLGTGLEWQGLRVGYSSELEPTLATASTESWWNAVRRVPSSSVAIRTDSEKFLFYDGAVALRSPTEYWSPASGSEQLFVATRDYEEYPSPGWLLSRPPSVAETLTPVPAVVVVRKLADSPVAGAILRSLSPNDAPRVVDLAGLTLAGAEVERALHDELTRSGLTDAEATSLIDAWRPEFFETEGTRVLTVMPRWLYDLALPIEIYPSPSALERVGVAWSECRTIPSSRSDSR